MTAHGEEELTIVISTCHVGDVAVPVDTCVEGVSRARWFAPNARYLIMRGDTAVADGLSARTGPP